MKNKERKITTVTVVNNVLVIDKQATKHSG